MWHRSAEASSAVDLRVSRHRCIPLNLHLWGERTSFLSRCAPCLWLSRVHFAVWLLPSRTPPVRAKSGHVSSPLKNVPSPQNKPADQKAAWAHFMFQGCQKPSACHCLIDFPKWGRVRGFKLSEKKQKKQWKNKRNVLNASLSVIWPGSLFPDNRSWPEDLVCTTV